MSRDEQPTSRTPTPGALRAVRAAERLAAGRALGLYREGWFPMWDEESGRTEWVQPEERAVVPLDGRFVVSRSLRARVRSGRFVVTTDVAFERVVSACAEVRAERPETWIGPEVAWLAGVLHRAGAAHSVEAWLPAGPGTEGVKPGEPGVLVGGLYGVRLGSCFAGESMFSRPDLGGTDASKVCLVHLVHHLRRRGFDVLDAQLMNDHLARFGAFEMPRREFLSRLDACVRRDPGWGPFEPGRTAAELGGSAGVSGSGGVVEG